MPAIQFFSEKIRYRLPNPGKTKTWVKSVIKKEGASLEGINFIFCTDKYLQEINIEYLNHKTFTDIITFNYGDKKTIEGDVYISIERVKENALKFQVPFQHELHRVIIHGVLHLLGYNDKTKTEKARMREKEDAYLSLRK
jgi:rRNA maturation RNase YbeY